jgi:hypothetical protein
LGQQSEYLSAYPDIRISITVWRKISANNNNNNDNNNKGMESRKIENLEKTAEKKTRRE